MTGLLGLKQCIKVSFHSVVKAPVPAPSPPSSQPTNPQPQPPKSDAQTKAKSKEQSQKVVQMTYADLLKLTSPKEKVDQLNKAVKAKKLLCSHFQVGSCTEGDACIFSHGQHAKQKAQPQPESQLKPKKGMCWRFAKGKCTRGESCMYSHDGPGGVAAASSATSDQCWLHAKGKCRFKNCKFSHTGKKDCIHWCKAGKCNYGDDCHWGHRDICKDYLNKKCNRGDSCRYVHPTDRA